MKRSKGSAPPPGGPSMKITPSRLVTAAAAAAALVTMSACSSGLGGGTSSTSAAGGGGGGSKTLTLLVDNGPNTIKSAQALIDAFKQQNPGVDVKMDTRPQGTEGDNLVKTK